MRDYEKMKIVSVPEEYSRFTHDGGITSKTDKKMAKNTDYSHTTPIYIRTDDFDTNLHVNNAKYFSFMYECDDVMDYENYVPDEILLNFVGGINHKDGNTMSYLMEDTEDGIKLSQKICSSGGETAAVMESYWRKI